MVHFQVYNCYKEFKRIGFAFGFYNFGMLAFYINFLFWEFLIWRDD